MRFVRDFISKTTGKVTDYISWVMSRCTSMVVRVMVVVLVLLVSFWLSLFLHLILVQILVPTKSFSWPAYLDLEPDLHHLGGGNLTAVVPLADSPALDTHCILPPPPSEGRKKQSRESAMPVCSGEPLAGPALLKRGQRYSVVVELVLPDSRPNRHHPMFHVQVTMLDASYNDIRTSRRPLLVPYRSKVQRVASALLHVPYLLFVDSFPETHTVRTPVYENYLDDPQRPARFARLQLVRSGGLQVLSARLHIQASFSGLQHLLDQHPLLCAAVGTLVNMTLVLAACVVVYFRRMENLDQQRRQRKLAKASRLADSEQALRGDKKAPQSGDSAEPSSVCDIDGEPRLQQQTEDTSLRPSEPTTNEKLPEKSARRRRRSSSLKKRDSFREKKHSLGDKSDQSSIEKLKPSLENEGALGTKKVSFSGDETNPSLQKKDSLEVRPSLEEKEDLSLVRKPVSLPDGGDSFDTKSKDRDLTCKNESCADDQAGSYFLKPDEGFDANTGVRKRVVDVGGKSNDGTAVQEISIQLTENDEQKSCEIGVEQAGFDASLIKDGNFDASPTVSAECSVPAAKMKETDCAFSNVVQKVDCVPPPSDAVDVNCTSSPPVSPVSTTSCGSQSSLGDFTLLN